MVYFYDWHEFHPVLLIVNGGSWWKAKVPPYMRQIMVEHGGILAMVEG